MAWQTTRHGRTSHTLPGGRGVQTLEHTTSPSSTRFPGAAFGTREPVSPRRLGVSQGFLRAGGGGAWGKNGVSTGHGQATVVGLVTYWGTCVCSRGCEVIVIFSHSGPGYGALSGHLASQAGLALPSIPSVTAVPALQCPPWAFGEPSWTCSTSLTDARGGL